MTTPDKVSQLVTRFDNNLEAYRSGKYNEAQLRQEFLNPLFIELGWDVYNEQGHAEAYKDVIHEDSIKMGAATKAPDYCFRIGGTRKFFLEAKKPSIDIKGNVHPAYQLRRYAWSAKLPLSILTDFEELAVYDCRQRPALKDKASTARTHYIKYNQYPDRWDEIASIFSKDAVLKGSFDKYAESGKRHKPEVDSEFLKEIESWRDMLAKNIALRNTALTTRQLNFAVQRTIDRLIFLRICEDRGIERYSQLLALRSGDNVYKRLLKIYYTADERYNSGLFHFEKEKSRPGIPDELTTSLNIDDKPLKDIIKNLYYPDSPYEFSVLPADILGQVYEQFLGKVITLTKGHHAKIQDKPEVKKAGGVYYTPTYIVDYIVKNTVGKLLQNKKTTQVAKLRILDPACGSGSFLIGAYQHLLDWHRDWYVNDNQHSKLYQTSAEEWKLTTAERKQILLNNIYGVDIDSQAVEVTKLSLLLKVLEGENEETIAKQLKLFHERALPDLSGNIKCGNSLIGPDFYQAQQLDLFDEEERLRINAFDWHTEFPDIFKGKNPGFDAVIGNPPWLMAGYYIDEEGLDHLRKSFRSAKGKFDLYYIFIEKGCGLISDKGMFAMIVPNKFFHTRAASGLRCLLAEQQKVQSIVDFGSEKIFATATNYSSILFVGKQTKRAPMYTRAKAGLDVVRQFSVPWSILEGDTWHFEDESVRKLFEKIEKAGTRLQELVSRFGTGVQTGADKLLVVDAASARAQGLEQQILRPVLRGRDVRRYNVELKPRLLILPYEERKGEFAILQEKALRQHKIVYELLSGNKEKLSQRIWFGKNAEELSGKWYGMMYLDSLQAFQAPHILTPALSSRSNFALGTGDLFATGTAGVTSIIPKDDIPEDILYILGLLNSSLLQLYIISHSPVFSGGYYKFSAPYLKNIPIHRADLSGSRDKAQHDQMVGAVSQMLSLRREVASAKTDHEKTSIQRQIDATDNQIDQLVYSLYDLTSKEIEIVRGSGPDE